MTVKVTINGKSWRFLVDTGSQVTELCVNEAVIKFEKKEILFSGDQKPIPLRITDAGLSTISKEELFILSTDNLYFQHGEVRRIQGYCKTKHDSLGIPAQGLVDLNYSTRLPVSVVRELRGLKS